VALNTINQTKPFFSCNMSCFPLKCNTNVQISAQLAQSDILFYWFYRWFTSICSIYSNNSHVGWLSVSSETILQCRNRFKLAHLFQRLLKMFMITDWRQVRWKKSNKRNF